MRCKVCGEPAVINMRHHRLSLCGAHFLQWVPRQVARAIETYHMFEPQERLLVAVSGGKDSLALWDILLDLGYQADGVYINLGIGDYSAQSQARARAFADRRGARLRVYDLAAVHGATMPQIIRRKRGRTACSVCGLVKRHVMNQAAQEGGYGAIVTGHNLDDEVAILLQNTLRWSIGYLGRQGPVLPSSWPGLARKVKPLCRTRERETAAYALLKGIDYVYDECPFSKDAATLFYKDLLNRLDARSPGSKETFYLQFLQTRAQYNLFGEERATLEMHTCPQCGQSTGAPDGELCAFCRLWADDNQ